MKAAAENGHLEIVVWLGEHRQDNCTGDTPYFAAYNGHLRVVRWLRTQYPNEFEALEMIDAAAHNGHLEIVRWLNDKSIGICTTDAMDAAARNGHLDVVLYLLEHRNEGFSGDAMTRTRDLEVHCLFGYRLYRNGNRVMNDQLKMLDAVYQQRPAFLQGCLRCLAEIAVDRSNIEILDWLYPFGLELCSSIPIRDAVIQRNVLKWFHQNGFKLRDPDLLELAVQNDQLNVAHWLAKHGYQTYSLGLVEVAGRHKNTPLLRFFIGRGPPLNLSVVRTLAIELRHVEIVSWISESDRVQLIVEALGVEDRELLWWILTRTHFEEEHSQLNIRDGINCAPTSTNLWLQKNLAGFEVYAWCFATLKRRRGGDRGGKRYDVDVR